MQRSHHSSNICTWQLTDGIKDTCSASVTNIVDTLNCRSSQDTFSEMIKDSPARNESECLGPGATLTQDETDTQRGNEGVLSAVTAVSQSGRTRIRHLRPLRSLLNCCIIRAQVTVTHSRFGKVASLRPFPFYLSARPSSAAFKDATCGRHWDDYLCWPVSGVGSTVRIPCRDSLPFVQAVMEAMPDFERDEIKGKRQKQNPKKRCSANEPWSQLT